MGGLPFFSQSPLTPAVHPWFLGGLGSLFRGPLLPLAHDHWRYYWLGVVPAFIMESDQIRPAWHGRPFTVSLSPMGELGPLPQARRHRTARGVGMWSQQGFHLFQFAGTPPLSPRLGGDVTFHFRILVEGPQKGRGVQKIVWFLIMSYQDRHQDPSGRMSTAPNRPVAWDEFLGNVH